MSSSITCARIDALKTEIEEKKKEQEMLFTTGKPDKAEALGWEIKENKNLD